MDPFGKWLVLGVLLIVVLIAAAYPQSAPVVADLTFEKLFASLGGIFVIVLLVERATEIVISIWRQPRADELQEEISPLQRDAAMAVSLRNKAAELGKKLQGYKAAAAEQAADWMGKAQELVEYGAEHPDKDLAKQVKEFAEEMEEYKAEAKEQAADEKRSLKELTRELDESTPEADLANAEWAEKAKRLASYKAETKGYSLLIGFGLSVFVCAAGVGLLGEIIDIKQGNFNFLRGVDIVLTSGLIAGGSDAFHQFVRTLETFFTESTKSMKDKNKRT